MTINVTHASTRHTFKATAPEGAPFIVTSGEDQIATSNIDIEISLDATGTLRVVGTFYTGTGRALSADGTPTRAKRQVQGTNLSRLPQDVRLALQESIREAVGAVHDPNGQLNGLDNR